ncbi:hypothetical protein PM082_014057 [Marasmius tenuissimus]|nr:hypothetical protein PM082_014057 [Marasmius tenuissimus]
MEHGKTLKRANPSTIHDKFLVGYQGWFTCAGDGEPIDPGHHGWLHWFNQPIPAGGRPTVDLWPDVSDYSPSELYSAPGINHKNGEPAKLFSSRHPQTVQRHFHWMARHGVDGAFLQRFAGQCDTETRSPGLRRLRDEIGDRVRDAAEKEGRVFAIMYDVSGVPSERVAGVVERDWLHLLHEKRVLESPSYLKEKGKPVIALWGFGFDGRNHTPELVRQIVHTIRSVTPGGAYVLAGTPTHWRTATEDADRNPGFLDVWLNDFDAISPWMVGRVRNNDDVERFAEYTMKFDIELLRKRHEEGNRKVDYLPVVFPGFSGLNLTEGRWGLNDIKREGGRFLWKQIFSAKRLGVRSMYGAMWDEYDEGTALMPVVEKARLLPDGGKYPFLALDAEGYDLPADWYMKICGFAGEGLRSERMIHETFPSKELQDYWSSRPKYEEERATEEDQAEGSGRQAYEQWLDAQKESKDEAPPPPYSLEAEEVSVATSSTSAQPQGSSASTGASSAPAEAVPTPISAPISTVVASQQSSPHISHPNTPQPRPQGYALPGPDVNSLANDFSRHGIASSPSPTPLQSLPVTEACSVPPIPSTAAGPPASSPSPRPLMSPPPLHPASRPRPNLASRPSSRPRPPQETRPPSQQSDRPVVSFPQGPQFPSPEPQSQQQWPPQDWGINRPPTAQANYQPYPQPSPSPQLPPQQGYASPPGTASHTPTTPNFGGPTGPHPYQSYEQDMGPQAPISFPQAFNTGGPSSYGPAMNSTSAPAPTFPSNMSSQSHISFPMGPSSQPYDSQNAPYPPGPCGRHGAYPGSSVSSQPYAPPLQTPQGSQGSLSHSTLYGNMSQNNNRPDTPGRPSSASGSGGSSYSGLSFPTGPAGDIPGGYRSSYIQSGPPNPHIPPTSSSHSFGPGSGPWTPPSEGYYPQPSASPPVPPRPPPRPMGTPVSNQSSVSPGPTNPYNNSNGPSTSTPSSSSTSSSSSSPVPSSSAPFGLGGSVGYAMNAFNTVQKVATRTTRDQLETLAQMHKTAGRSTRDQLESLTQTGGKFFNKFK